VAPVPTYPVYRAAPMFEMTKQSSEPVKEAVIFTLFEREYHIFGEKIINDVEASPIYEKLLKEPAQSASWREDETNLLQWSVFTYGMQKKKYIEDFKEDDWKNIAQFIPTKDHNKCLKRWLFIQRLGGNKLKWSAQEDLILKQVVDQTGAKVWNRIADIFNQQTN